MNWATVKFRCLHSGLMTEDNALPWIWGLLRSTATKEVFVLGCWVGGRARWMWSLECLCGLASPKACSAHLSALATRASISCGVLFPESLQVASSRELLALSQWKLCDPYRNHSRVFLERWEHCALFCAPPFCGGWAQEEGESDKKQCLPFLLDQPKIAGCAWLFSRLCSLRGYKGHRLGLCHLAPWVAVWRDTGSIPPLSDQWGLFFFLSEW